MEIDINKIKWFNIVECMQRFATRIKAFKTSSQNFIYGGWVEIPVFFSTLATSPHHTIKFVNANKLKVSYE